MCGVWEFRLVVGSSFNVAVGKECGWDGVASWEGTGGRSRSKHAVSDVGIIEEFVHGPDALGGGDDDVHGAGRETVVGDSPVAARQDDPRTRRNLTLVQELECRLETVPFFDGHEGSASRLGHAKGKLVGIPHQRIGTKGRRER